MSISVIGNGNVAFSLIPALIKANYTIDFLVGRNLEHLQPLASQYDISFTNDYNLIESEIVIITVSDNAIETVSSHLTAKSNKLVLHTAGSVSLDILTKNHSSCGVLYPLQTFSKTRPIDIGTVPLCIEGSGKTELAIIQNLAQNLSSSVTQISSSERLSIHTAAVFVSNFTNLMYTYGAKIMEDTGLDFNILRPLIQETAQKVMQLSPAEAQTGPALRNDTNTLMLHNKQLNEAFTKKYNTLTAWIQEFYNK